MKFSIITLFPEVFIPTLNSSILKRAQAKELVEFDLINLRDFGQGPHKTVDDSPYGGGAGMVLKADVLAVCVKKIKDLSEASLRVRFKIYEKNHKSSIINPKSHIILMSASGTPYSQKKARELSSLKHIILICGHYEGVDQRFVDKYVDEEISIGDYVLTGGEIPAMVLADSITRLIPGVLEKPEATLDESFSQLPTTNSQLLEYPQYTRPDEFEGEKVPEILVSGNHGEIKKWREEKSKEKTKKIRPDMLNNK